MQERQMRLDEKRQPAIQESMTPKKGANQVERQRIIKHIHIQAESLGIQKLSKQKCSPADK